MEDKLQALKKLQELVSDCKDLPSESGSRTRLIESLFKDCLGWSETEITREFRTPSGSIDYIFSIDGIRTFILEEKGREMRFEIPDTFSQRYYKIRGAISADPRLTHAIERVQSLCIETGVRYGVFTNGYQYIIFEAFKQGRPWWEARCMVFRSWEDINRNFSLFYNVLGRDSVKNGSLSKYISEEPMLEGRNRVNTIVQERLVDVPEELKKYLPRILLKPDFEILSSFKDDYFMLAFLDADEFGRIKKKRRLNLEEFPGLIKPKGKATSEGVMFSLEKAKNAMFEGLSIEAPFAFDLGKDCTLILCDYRQSFRLKGSCNEIAIGLAYIISFGDEINRYNVYDFLEDLIAYSLKQWKSTHA